MKKTLAAASLIVGYAAAAAVSWWLIGNALWTGSDIAQVLVPALMSLATYLMGEVAVGLANSIQRRSRLASLAMLGALLVFVILSIAAMAG